MSSTFPPKYLCLGSFIFGFYKNFRDDFLPVLQVLPNHEKKKNFLKLYF